MLKEINNLHLIWH